MRRPRRSQPNKRVTELAVENWNLKHPVGTDVEVTKDDGAIQRTKTRSKAEVFGDYAAVIWLDGVAGCYLLSRVKEVC